MQASESHNIETISWNPFTGCTKISPACQNCYAEELAIKLNSWGTAGYENKFEFTIHEDRIAKAAPLKRKKPSLYFINSMSDIFHENANDEILDKVFEIIEKASWHNFYMLTKRSDRMKKYFQNKAAPKNAWLGVTVEDKKHGFPRLADLQNTNASNKHICCEPLLEELTDINLKEISLVVAGGESGKNARRADITWVESLRNSCAKQDVHFYWKSWGTYNQDGTFRNKKQSGCLINGKEYKSFPKNLMP